ncbi:hypothetical protein CVD28_02260 [Bacillus sp. M6-12]|uniref:hypothetical protein n=1 Tax=Bacillus sp. M6-12 TaxID=2054166 RepID=UPI000C77F50E|nr:hypothetical protein [Bacillus sp. M6-12]PLS19256.1 hypothetical protein CVD28_02260 [Bacillus sp. M6-12]
MEKNIYLGVISEYYEGKVAKRTQVPYINHIFEGLKVLNAIGATQESKDAYCLHPIYQAKKTQEELDYIAKYESSFNPHVVLLAKEYAKTANSYLCKRHYQSKDDVVTLSEYPEVNDMLIADKVQNRKDFEMHYESQENKDTFDRSDRLSQYFKNWLNVLGIPEEQYQEYKEMLA